MCHRYEATIIWDRGIRIIEVIESETESLLVPAGLYGYLLTVGMAAGGAAAIGELPAAPE